VSVVSLTLFISIISYNYHISNMELKKCVFDSFNISISDNVLFLIIFSKMPEKGMTDRNGRYLC